jgi:dipeptide transport system ATP-binding protein
MDLQAEFNLAYLFISHDLSVVQHIAKDVMVMYLGRPVEHGPKEAIFAAPRHPYTQALLAATPSVDPKARSKRLMVKGELPSPINPPSGCAFHRRCPFATDLCAKDRPELRPLDGRPLASPHPEKNSAMAAEGNGLRAGLGDTQSQAFAAHSVSHGITFMRKGPATQKAVSPAG